MVDLSPSLGQEIMIRLVDRETAGWGHINFDDFRLHRSAAGRPSPPATGDGRRLPARGPRPGGGRAGDDRPPGLPRLPVRRRARRRAADRDGDRRPGPALGRRGVLISPSRPGRPGTRPHPDPRGQGRRRPLRHAQGLRRPAEPRQRPGARLRRRLGRCGPSSALHPRQGRRRSTGWPAPRPARRLGPARHARDAQHLHLGARRLALRLPRGVHPLARRQARGRRATGVHRSTPASGGTIRPDTSSRSSPTARATPGASTSTRGGR